LYPNPNNGNFILQQMTMDDKPVTAEIWNSVGQSIYKEAIHFDGGKTNLRIINATPGLYLLKLTDSKTQTFILKFVIDE
jgi:hypothetical protein